MTFRMWMYGLLASMISAVATVVLASNICSSTGEPLKWSQLGNIAISGAVVGAAFYFKQSPLPKKPEGFKPYIPRNQKLRSQYDGEPSE